MPTHREPLDLIRAYFERVSRFETEPAAYAGLLHPEIEQIEYPNAIVTSRQVRDLGIMLQGAQAGKALLAEQSMEIVSSHGNAEIMTVEAIWRGTVAVDRGPFKAGQELKAWLCMVFEFEDGLIRRQRNYDCYEPF